MHDAAYMVQKQAASYWVKIALWTGTETLWSSSLLSLSKQGKNSCCPTEVQERDPSGG